MKQILLGIAAVFPKVLLCERAQPRCVQSSRPRKVAFAQDPLDPDIDREGAQTFIGKEHHTISNLRAHARQLAELGPKIDIGKPAPFFQIDFARPDASRRRQQILSAITERASAQLFLRTARNLFWSRKCEEDVIIGGSSSPLLDVNRCRRSRVDLHRPRSGRSTIRLLD